MKKAQQTIISIILLFIILTFAGSAFAENACVIKWWERKSGWKQTEETSSTQKAAEDLHLLIHGGTNLIAKWVGDCLVRNIEYSDGEFDVKKVCLDGTWSYYGNSCSPDILDYSGNWDVICGQDSDNDTLPDVEDNCPYIYNVQDDCDNDGQGDVCEIDNDSDKIPDDCDNCPEVYNPGQVDCDSDGLGDSCDPDTVSIDGDGVDDSCDNCPLIDNPDQLDGDSDKLGNACDPVFNGDLTIYDRKGIEALSGHLEITGYLQIDSRQGSPIQIISNLQGLESLTAVGDDLNIFYNDVLTSLEGLKNLTSIAGDLQISANTLLTSLKGLDNLAGEVESLNIKANPVLSSLNGLDNITGVNRALYVNNNDLLTSLKGLDSVSGQVDLLSISYNPRLISLAGLENLTGVAEYLGVSHNNLLINLSGLNNLANIDGWVEVYSNDALVNFNGFENLVSVGSRLDISYNWSLFSLSGLDSLTDVGGSMHIFENKQLSSLDGLESLTSVGKDEYFDLLSISFNDSLTDLCGLYNLTSDNSYFHIKSNDMLSPDTANALDEQLRKNGYTGRVIIEKNNGSELVTCDLDEDGIKSDNDNCPAISNPDQADADNDGVGNVCDNCPDTVNPNQNDCDDDGLGNACDPDSALTVFPDVIYYGWLLPHYSMVVLTGPEDKIFSFTDTADFDSDKIMTILSIPFLNIMFANIFIWPGGGSGSGEGFDDITVTTGDCDGYLRLMTGW